MNMLIRVCDLETTGFTPPEHDVIEFGWCDVESTTRDLSDQPAGWRAGLHQAVFVNPGRSIPPEASAIHHIIDEDVSNGIAFAHVMMLKVNGTVEQVGTRPPEVFAAHNAKFERQWITDKITGGKPWVCTYKCALRLWPDAPSHSNQALRYWRKPPLLIRDYAREAHRAGPDAYVTAHLLTEMLETTPVETLIEWSSQPALQVRCHIGKWRGTPWREVDDGFLHWIIDKDFDEDVLFTVKHEFDRREKEREQASLDAGDSGRSED